MPELIIINPGICVRNKKIYAENGNTVNATQLWFQHNPSRSMTPKQVSNNLALLPKLYSPSKHEYQFHDILNENYGKSYIVETQ